MVPQTLETPIGCWASQSLGGNAWREGSWISLEIKRPMTHQLLEATDVGKSAGCLKPRGSTSSCRNPHLAGKHGKKQWEKQLGSASGHGHAPRVKSRFATLGGSARRSSPKMLKTRPLPTTSVFRACPSCEMCQWNNDLLRWWCMIKPNNWYSNCIQAPFLGYKAWKRPFVLRSSWEKLRFNNHVPIFQHLRLCIACFHLQLNFPSQSAHTIEFVDRIRRAGKDGPSHHDKRDHHHSNFLLNAVAGHRKPGRELHGSTWQDLF